MLRKRIEGTIMILIPFAIVFTTWLGLHLNPAPSAIKRVDVVGVGYFTSTIVLVIIEIVLIHDWLKKSWAIHDKKDRK